jgi:hypothetical protein
MYPQHVRVIIKGTLRRRVVALNLEQTGQFDALRESEVAMSQLKYLGSAGQKKPAPRSQGNRLIDRTTPLI